MTKLTEMKSTELKKMAKGLKIKNWWTLKKTDLITAIEAAQTVVKKVKEIEEETEKEVNQLLEDKNQENLITVKEIIAESGIKGTKARRLLRNSNIERPYKRWEWDKDLHKDIIKQVRDLLK